MIDIQKILKSSNIKYKKNILLKDFTTTKVGGPAKYLVTAKKQEELVKIFNLVKKNKIDYLIIGAGSNLLISDKLVIKGLTEL